MKAKQALVFIILLSVLAVTSLKAQAPQLINYQGKLVINGDAANGTFAMTFSVYSTEEGVTPLWTETRSVIVTDGVFNVLLGSVESFPDTLFK